MADPGGCGVTGGVGDVEHGREEADSRAADEGWEVADAEATRLFFLQSNNEDTCIRCYTSLASDYCY